MKAFWTRRLIGQWIMVMLLALGISQVLFYFIFRAEQMRSLREVRREEFLARTASVVRLVNTVGPELHSEILGAANTPVVRFWFTTASIEDPIAWQNEGRNKMLEPPRPPAAADLPPQADAKWDKQHPNERPETASARLMHLEDWNGFGLQMPVGPNLWLQGVYAKPASTGPPWYYHLSMGISAVLLTLGAVMLVRRVGRPLERLAEAAEKVGRGEEMAPLPEEGADDIRHTTAAFNRMQERLRRFVQDRTQMVAAMSHDLRTPITSMRLRAEFISEADTREKIIATLDEMKAIAESTLAFAREEAATEPTRTVDLNALLESLCDDLAGLGWDVTFAPGNRTPWRCRPDAMRRAVRNVVENSVRYGHRARVALEVRGQRALITVDDDGTGISEEDSERVFNPFVRLESSRNRGTGGVGLGLSIARTIIRSHGGDITLANRPGGGLRANIELPND
ncbi:ATP-binding protein [Verrucomicrobium spinosum]|uniref:ATP-binding protein n=1 Tax=Verrucomicrobium spinosum TaxID=2736 RepID=UPI000174659F|nr:ATP-binding protein [Verrucomicrobium spinosum]